MTRLELVDRLNNISDALCAMKYMFATIMEENVFAGEPQDKRAIDALGALLHNSFDTEISAMDDLCALLSNEIKMHAA